MSLNEKREPAPLMLRVAGVLLFVALLTLCMLPIVQNIGAKYMTGASAADSARVAKFDVAINGSEDLEGFEKIFDNVKLSPMSSPVFYELKVQNNSEVAINLDASMESEGNLPLVYYWKDNDGSVTDDSVLQVAQTEPSATLASYTKFANNAALNEDCFTGYLAAVSSKTYTIAVAWDDSQESSSYAFSNGVTALKLSVMATQAD